MVPGCELNEWSMMDSSGGPLNRTHPSFEDWECKSSVSDKISKMMADINISASQES